MATRLKEDEEQIPPLVVKRTLLERIDDAWRDLRYANRSEFLREAIEAGVGALLKKGRKEAPKG